MCFFRIWVVANSIREWEKCSTSSRVRASYLLFCLSPKLRNVYSTILILIFLFSFPAFKDEEDYFSESITVTNHDNHIAKVSNRLLFSLRFKRKNPLLSEGFSCTTSYSSSGAIREIVIWKAVETLDEARNAINAFRRSYPMLVSGSQVAVSRREVSKIESYRKVDCTGRDSEKTVYQMLPNNCSGMKSLTIKGVKLVCSTENLSCKIGMTVSLSTYRA